MQFNIENKVGARFKLVAHKGDGVPVRETGWFNNLVLDAGLDRMSAGAWINRCCVGSGNSVPTRAQVQLDNLVASTTDAQVSSKPVTNLTTPIYYGALRTWRFGAGIAAGNISEVGMGWADNSLWNRALVRDINGNPTTITVLSDEYLDVVSEVRVYPAETLSGQFNLLNKSGEVVSTHMYTGHPAFMSEASWEAGQISLGSGASNYMGVYSGDIGSISESPSGTAGWMTPTRTFPTLRSSRAVGSLGLSQANFSHKACYVAIGSLMGSLPGYQLQIDPPITKTNTQLMTYTFEMSWDRYEGS